MNAADLLPLPPSFAPPATPRSATAKCIILYIFNIYIQYVYIQCLSRSYNLFITLPRPPYFNYLFCVSRFRSSHLNLNSGKKKYGYIENQRCAAAHLSIVLLFIHFSLPPIINYSFKPCGSSNGTTDTGTIQNSSSSSCATNNTSNCYSHVRTHTSYGK